MTKEQMPPTYETANQRTIDQLEKPQSGNETKHIDAALDSVPHTRDNIRSIGEALIRVADKDEDTKAATEDAVLNLTTLLKNVKVAKKSGEWSKEEKKALKREMKTLSKGLKSEVKEIWKSSKLEKA